MTLLIPAAECNALLAALGKTVAASPLQDWQKLAVVWAWVVAIGSQLTDEQQDAMTEVAGMIAAHMGEDRRTLN